MNESTDPLCQVILFTAPHCAYCPGVSKIFNGLNEQGKLSSYEKFDLSIDSSLAEKYNIRSVPWFKINDLEFFGSHSASEIEYWVDHSHTNTGILRYIVESLDAGKLSHIENLIRTHPYWLPIALGIVSDLNSPIQARIGLAATLEGLAGEPVLNTILPQLETLIGDPDHRMRADACHYLGLLSSPKRIELLTSCLTDPHPEVRELAEDGLGGLTHAD